MTNQDAINFLNQVRKMLLDDKSWLESTTQQINEAFDMAISALEKQIPEKTGPKEFGGDEMSITPEEAIAILNDMKVGVSIPKAAVTQRKRNVALDMAISTMSCSEILNSSDCISRQAAIDALKGLPTWWEDEGGYYGGAQPPMVALLDPEDAVSAIANLPSAQPEWNNHTVACLQNGSKSNFCPHCGADMRGEQNG